MYQKYLQISRDFSQGTATDLSLTKEIQENKHSR